MARQLRHNDLREKEIMKDKRLYHEIADKITKLIDDGTYPPGIRLPGERKLAEKFGVSRVTVREAEIALQAQGVISIKMGSGVYVADSAKNHRGALPDVSAFELTEARALFESEAAALAAQQIGDEVLDHLTDLIGTMASEDSGDEATSAQADREFHLAIAAASGNAAVQYIVETLWKLRTELPAVKEVYAAICKDETGEDRGAEHAEVLLALRNRDPSAARLAMQKHFKRLLTSMIDVTEEQALKELREKSTESRRRFLDSGNILRTRKQGLQRSD